MTDIIVITKSIAFNSSAFCKYFIAIIIEATITAIGNMQNRIARITTNSPTKINFNTQNTRRRIKSAATPTKSAII